MQNTNWNDVRAAIETLHEAGAVYEIRLPKGVRKSGWKRSSQAGGFFNDADMVIKALEQVERADAVYITLNPVDAAMLARFNNRLEWDDTTGKLTKDSDAIRRRWLLVDADPVRPAGVSATAIELDAARQLCESAQALVAGIGFLAPIKAMSGNGWHQVYRIDLPNDKAAADLCKACLEALDYACSTPAATIDTSVWNAARVCKLWGTAACKGDGTPDRPHRTSQILALPPGVAEHPASLETLKKLAALRPPDYEEFRKLREAVPGLTKDSTEWKDHRDGRRHNVLIKTVKPTTHSKEAWDVRRWIADHGVGVIRDDGGNKILVACPWRDAHSSSSASEAAILMQPDGAVGYKCQHAHCSGKGWREFRQAFEPDAYLRRSGQAAAQPAALDGGVPVVYLPDNASAEPVRLTDAAQLMGKLCGDSAGLYLHAGEVVRFDGSGILLAVGAAEMQSVMETVADLRTTRNGKQGRCERRVFATKALAESILASEAFRTQLPRIAVVSPCPVAVESGAGLRIVTSYDRESGVLVTGGDCAEVGLDEATRLLTDILCDFDFASESDRSRAIAGLVTPALVLGGLLGGRAPVDLGEADQSQSGKGYRAKLVAAVYGCRQRVITQRAGGTGSLEESFSAALLEGASFVSLDNVRGKIDSPAIESALTEDTFYARAPYRKPTRVPMERVVVAMTTNQAELTRDQANRTSPVNIRKRPEAYAWRPWQEGDLLAHVRANQGRYLGAVLAVVRAWHGAGKPRSDERRHDFRQWAQTLDWVVQRIFRLAPLCDGIVEAKERMSNPHLGWLRQVALAVVEEGRDGAPLRTHELVRIMECRSVEIPGASQGLPEGDDESRAVLQQAGRRLTRAFGGADRRLELGEVWAARGAERDEQRRQDVHVYTFGRRVAATVSESTIQAITPCLDNGIVSGLDAVPNDGTQPDGHQVRYQVRGQVESPQATAVATNATGAAPDGGAFAPDGARVAAPDKSLFAPDAPEEVLPLGQSRESEHLRPARDKEWEASGASGAVLTSVLGLATTETTPVEEPQMPSMEEFARLWNDGLPPLPPGWAPPPEFNAGGVAQSAAAARPVRTLRDVVAEEGFYSLPYVPVFGGDADSVWPIPLEVTANGTVAAT